MKRYYLSVHGEVQGVGFRFFTYRTARSLSLTGWVRNNYDGTVDIEVQGEENYIKEFIRFMYRGNGFSTIDDIIIDEISIKPEETTFRITY